MGRATIQLKSNVLVTDLKVKIDDIEIAIIGLKTSRLKKPQVAPAIWGLLQTVTCLGELITIVGIDVVAFWIPEIGCVNLITKARIGQAT